MLDRHNYIIIKEDESNIIWQIYNVLPEIRIYEDGLVAEEHLNLACKMHHYNGRIVRYKTFKMASESIASRTSIDYWVHHFILSTFYKDKYAYRSS